MKIFIFNYYYYYYCKNWLHIVIQKSYSSKPPFLEQIDHTVENFLFLWHWHKFDRPSKVPKFVCFKYKKKIKNGNKKKTSFIVQKLDQKFVAFSKNLATKFFPRFWLPCFFFFLFTKCYHASIIAKNEYIKSKHWLQFRIV